MLINVVAIAGVVVVAVVMTAEDVDAAAGCPSCALLAFVNNCAIFMWISRRVHHVFTYGAFNFQYPLVVRFALRPTTKSGSSIHVALFGHLRFMAKLALCTSAYIKELV